MTPERWRQVEALYHAVLDLPLASRPALLERADPDVRREVESLLAQDGSALDHPAWVASSETMPGKRLGNYQIEVQIGAGGMGQVYRAVDSRLGRKVAIKVATRQFGERLEREAQAISALNHPHICTLYDVGPNYLVMEFVEGETIAARLKKGAMSMDDVLRYGSEIADALAEAHSKAITHRDLKPANVMIAKSGVKVLDFGLAKFPNRGDGPDATLTQAGAVVGTLAYMAPEQIEGQQADARTDIYALGLVLYEMATGKRMAQGQPAALDTLPERFAHVMERCLAREPENRWQTASDVKAELGWAAKTPSAVTVIPSRNRWPYVAAVLGLAIIGAVWSFEQFRQTPVEERAVRLQIGPPSGGRFSVTGNAIVGGLALSPDGTTAAFVATVGDQTALWVRPLDSDSARLLPGTDGAAYPFWSPDSKSIAFSAKGKLQRVDVASGSPVTMWDGFGTAMSGAWLPGGGIVLSTPVAGTGGLLQATSSGGTLTHLTELDASRKEVGHSYPQSLPGNRLLYLAESSVPGNSAIYSISLAKPAERVLVLSTGVNALYASGHLLWWKGGTLVAQEFDPVGSKLTGEPQTLAERVNLQTPDSKMSVAVSENGYLLYDAIGIQRQLQWFDPTGKALGPLGDLKDPGLFRISPDGQRSVATAVSAAHAGVWVVDQNGLASSVTSQGQNFNSPIWSPDGRTIVFTMGSQLNLFRIDASGSSDAVGLTQTPHVQFATDWSRDGRFILFYENAPGTQRDLWILPVTPQGVVSESKARLYLGSSANESWGRFSPEPNPRWVAYQSDELDHFEVYIQSFPEPHGKFRISPRGGSYPMWGPDGHELYYESLDNKLTVVSLKFEADSVTPSAPRELFALPPAQSGRGAPPYDIAPDGKRFAVSVQIRSDSGLTLVTNWPALLKKGSATR